MEPTCPKCSSPMVVRTARRGKNAGSKFYGCSQYPTCKGTLPFGPNSPSERSETQETDVRPDAFFPHTITARSSHSGYQVCFYETAAVLGSTLESLHVNEMTSEFSYLFAQWRVDFPKTESSKTRNERTGQVVSVAEKILTRGHVVGCSPFLEGRLSKVFCHERGNSIQRSSLDVLKRLSVPTSTCFSFDSEPEELFYAKFLPRVLGSSFARWTFPQVEISSLLHPNQETSLTGRVDFLISHPNLQRPIVVEIDGAQHQEHIDRDVQRDELLRNHGYDVMRIPSAECQSLQGECLSRLSELMACCLGNEDGQITNPDTEILSISATQTAHQIQVVILQAIKAGLLDLFDSGSWLINTDLHKVGYFTEREAFVILEAAIEDLTQLLRNLGDLYSIRLGQGQPTCSTEEPVDDSRQSLYISYSGRLDTNVPTYLVQNIHVPFHIANEIFPSTGAILDRPSVETLEYFLNYLFRKPKFWEGQYDAIARALQGKDAIVLLPTGAGKSIAFQLAALLLPGRAVVIEPIISLIEDQLDNLASFGINRCIGITSAITNAQDRSRAMSLFGKGEYLFAYVAPERFQTIEFRESIRALTVHTPIALIAVDEAHCVSEWGHDFRTSYLNIGRTSRSYCESNGFIPPLLALTGTASRAVL